MFDYRAVIWRIVTSFNGYCLGSDKGVFRFPDQARCNSAVEQLRKEVPEVRVYVAAEMLVTSTPYDRYNKQPSNPEREAIPDPRVDDVVAVSVRTNTK